MTSGERPPAPLRRIELSGPPQSMGEAFGEQFREGIRAFTEARMDRLLEHVHKYDPERDISREDVLAFAGRTAAAHRSCDPALWEEFIGIARAAGLTVEELLIENGLTDFRDAVLFQNPTLQQGPGDDLGECTAFLVPAKLADGHPLVGQTWDMNARAQNHLVVVHRRPDDSPETLWLTTVGCLGLIGMNAEGVSVGNTNLVPVDAGAGVNYLFTISHALGCATATEAADAIEATPRLSGHNFYVADERTAINVETAARRARRTVVEDGVFVHANHYVAEALRSLEFGAQDLANSRWRHGELESRFGPLRPPLTVDRCWGQLAHVTQGDDPASDAACDAVATCATVVQCPAERTLRVCAGKSRPGGYETLTL